MRAAATSDVSANSVQTSTVQPSSVQPRRRTSPREQIQSLERGLDVLTFMNRVGTCSNGQVAKAVHLTRSTAHRILTVLVNMELLRHDRLNHQYILNERVRALSCSHRDDEWVTGPAATRMSEWTRAHHWPLLLTTPLQGRLIVRASTDLASPQTLSRLIAGHVVRADGLTVGQLCRAYEAGASGLGTIRRNGYVAGLDAVSDAARISVPLLSAGEFFGCLTMRCHAQVIHQTRDLRHWVASLKALAATIGEEVGALAAG